MRQGYLLILLAIVVHLVYMMSIFDMYFRSPLVHGMKSHAPKLKPPAKRLVLFSADGLRYDRFFELNKTGEARSPFLRHVIRERGSWGVSHARVPTETRPGHVALISGFYEDVSAVTKGWKENPVEFDSLFNQSRHAWCWGAPEVVLIFVPRGGLTDRIATWTIPPDLIDLAHGDASELDFWVFDRVKEFFKNSTENQNLWDMLHRDQIVFFLHLVGLDVNGHAYKPISHEYLTNIPKVDQGVKEIVRLIDDYYNDNLTAYVFSSDHGMTDWGAHGAGNPEETLVPLVAWGAGIKGPQQAQKNSDFDPEFPDEWNLNKFKRMDILHADTTPLMSSVIGIPVPVNNVGVLPVQYLDASPAFKADALLANLQQILEIFEVKEAHAKAQTISLLYKPYEALSPSALIKRMGEIKDNIKAEQYEKAIELSDILIKQLLTGMRYYETYDRLFIGTVVVIGYLGWMLCILIELLLRRPKTYTGIIKAGLLNKAAFAIGLSSTVFLFFVSSPVTYYFYCLLPVLFWHRVAKYRHVIWSSLGQITKDSLIELGSTLVASIIATEALVFSFFERKTLSLGCCVLAVWPLMSKSVQTSKKVRIGWIASCLIVATCATLPLPTAADHSIYLIILGSLTAIGLTVYCLTRGELAAILRQNLTLFIFQIIWLVIATAVAVHTSHSLTNKRGLPPLNQALSWIVLVSSLVVPSLATKNVLTRLLSIALAFLPCHILLAMEYEVLFYVAFCCLMFFWLRIEQKSGGMQLKALQFGQNQLPGAEAEKYKERPMRMSDVQTAVLFIFFSFSAFFGTGNFASVNTFDPSSIRCFLTVLNPTIMGGLLLWKIVIPFVLVSCTFSAVHLAVRVPLRELFLVVLLFSDVMGLQFFFMVTDYGSWLEIGLSISHYVIMMLVTVITIILFGLAQILTGSVTMTSKSKST